MHLADLHIHSRYSRATSRELDPQHLDLWGRRKGLSLIGTGDLTHAAWREELRQSLKEAGNGFYQLRDELRLPCETRNAGQPLFVVSGEISTIYKKNGKTRKVHHVILLPGLDAADQLAHKLEAVGNIHSDGRPILGLDSHDLLEIVLESCPEAIYIPAHIWTPHFSLFGAFSGFDTVEECFGDLTPFVHAMETGLSSDPAMNRCLSLLDGYQLVSSSDAHSPSKLGREATLLDGPLDYAGLKTAIETGHGLAGTIEFFPEEGKYHLDGHRNCRCCLEPEETKALDGRCPVCGRRLTIGVLNRVRQLADRESPQLNKPYESLIPLSEILAECMGVTNASKKVESAYFELLERIGPEMTILRKASLEEITAAAGPVVAEAIRRLRAGKVRCQGGYDGEYGQIRVYEDGEIEAVGGQTSLLDALGLKPERKPKSQPPRQAQHQENDAPKAQPAPAEAAPQTGGLNQQQHSAVISDANTTAVIAGPGTGKTKTLVSRIVYLLGERRVSPKEITAVTFTRQAAQEMRERLEGELGKKNLRGLTIGTFHSIALQLLPKKSIADRETRLRLMAEALAEHGDKLSAPAALDRLSLQKNGKSAALSRGVVQAYQQRLNQAGLRDLDDVLLEALEMDPLQLPCFRYLLVDEFQDINAVQHRLVSHWSSGRNLFVIGDPDQSIYGFRGADAACFDRLLTDRPDTCVIRLEENYRSAGAVLESSLCLISQNPGTPRVLKAHRNDGEPVRMMTAADAYSEAAWIADEINAMVGGTDMLSAHRAGNLREAPRAFSEIAILARTHRQLETVENSLRRAGIPCVVCGRERFWENAAVQGLLSFFRWLRAPQDGEALQMTLHTLWKCPQPLIQQAQAASLQMETLDPAALKQALCAFDLLTSFMEAVEELAAEAPSAQPRKLLSQLAERTEQHGKALEALLNAAVFHKRIDDFLEALETGEETDIRRRSGAAKASGAISLMTLHAAKGLEFPVVFVAGINEGDLPHQQEGEETDEEEERRLLFVGMTRAKEELILTCSGQPSRFLQELPTEVKRVSIPRKMQQIRMEQLSLF